MEAAAADLLAMGARGVLVKGGHLPGETVTDLLASAAGTEVFENPRIDTPHTHGTGCTLASAIATGLAQGLSLRAAVVRARAYLLAALRHPPASAADRAPSATGTRSRPFQGRARPRSRGRGSTPADPGGARIPPGVMPLER